MELVRTSAEQYEKLKQLGFPINMVSKNPTPTIAFALKWLRDEKDIHVCPEKCSAKISAYAVSVQHGSVDDGNYVEVGDDMYLNSYEEAESAGLDISLDYLLKQK